jgi:hypothetical protein
MGVEYIRLIQITAKEFGVRFNDLAADPIPSTVAALIQRIQHCQSKPEDGSILLPRVKRIIQEITQLDCSVEMSTDFNDVLSPY